MWPGFDPSIMKDLATIREMVSRQHQTPTREWPLIHVDEHNALLVLREWPDGVVTAYTIDDDTRA
jgi:hypothetical protein